MSLSSICPEGPTTKTDLLSAFSNARSIPSLASTLARSRAARFSTTPALSPTYSASVAGKKGDRSRSTLWALVRARRKATRSFSSSLSQTCLDACVDPVASSSSSSLPSAQYLSSQRSASKASVSSHVWEELSSRVLATEDVDRAYPTKLVG
jgi:hypothetical protein